MTLLLSGGEQGQDRGNARDKRDFVSLDIAQRPLGVEGAHNDQTRARVERRGGTARVDAAAVEPRGHVHGDVGRVDREVHDHVVRREHLVDVVERYALGSTRGAGGLQPQHLVVDVRFKINRRIFGGSVLHIVLIEDVSLGKREVLDGAVDRNDEFGLVRGELERPDGGLGDFRVVEVNLGLVVADDLRGLTG